MIMDKGRSWVEIDLEKIKRNYLIFKNHVGDKRIMAVVKADAYGHGDVEISSCLQSIGCMDFAVSNIDEAIKLREFGINGQILILGYTPPSMCQRLIDYDITQTILSEDYADLLRDYKYRFKVQVAIDTGMNRIGLDADDPIKCDSVIRSISKQFELTGIFTHLCAADSKEMNLFTDLQFSKFERIVEKIEDLKLPYIHILNSAGGLYHRLYGNMVRLGIVLYGLKPDASCILPSGICQALTWKSVISMVKQVHVGETVGYGCSYEAKEEMCVATVPTGYADGFSRKLSNCGFVYVRQHKVPIVGRICMDQFMVDVTGVSNIRIGDEVVLTDSNYTLDDMASQIESIGYETVCNISKRVPRLYY